MISLEQLYKKLEEYSNFDEGDNAELFLETVDEIVLRQDPSSIKVLMSYLDDTCDYSWVYESLNKAIEHFPTEDYVQQICVNMEVMEKKAEEFLKYIIYLLLNDHSCRESFKRNIYLAPKKLLFKLFDIIEKESPEWAQLIKELRKERDKTS
jgi:hypothetical protein